jgi:hypothetical protein
VRASETLAVILLTLAGGSMVAAANFSRSYVPLFFAWAAFGAIPWVITRLETRRSGQPHRPDPNP